MNKIKVAITLFIFMCFITRLTAQCNTSVLEKRTYIKSQSQKEKVIFIRLSAQLTSQLLTDIATKSRKTGQYINVTLGKGVKPNLQALMDYLNVEKNRISKAKQMIETNKLDLMTFCYINFEIETYNKIQNIILQNEVGDIFKKIKAYVNIVAPIEEAKIADIMKEIQFIEAKFPINKSN